MANPGPTIKRWIKRLPGVVRLHCFWLEWQDARRPRKELDKDTLRRLSLEKIFTTIYKKKMWGDENTVSYSGPGSDPDETRVIKAQLPLIIARYGIRSMLDIPCGDFLWMKELDLAGVRYVGADIVKPLIRTNRRKYRRQGVVFEHIDLLRDELPRADLIFCRDCLIHLSLSDIATTIANIIRSGSTYLMATTYTSRTFNPEILSGQWRPINLQEAPFNFPPPVELINEESLQEADRSMGLWSISLLKGGRDREGRSAPGP